MLALCLIGWPARADEPAKPASSPPPSPAVDFAHDVRPIFAKRCYSCHGPEQAEASLRLDRKSDALRGGNSGPALEPGKSGASRLVTYITAAADDDLVMPPEGERLSTTEVALIRNWIDQGAPWPDEPAADRAKSNHWSFQPLRTAGPPPVKNAAWVRNPIDAYVLARLESLGIAPSPEAERATLVRRLSLDLLGLLPTPAEVEAFERDNQPDAYERLVDRLLASPHYGERWGRHWLDQARYADSDGYEKDTGRPFAWRYRQWVIDALNADMPFDRFTIEQLAGDLLPGATVEQRVATGFHRNTLTNREGGVDQEEFRVAATVDRVNTTGSVWLGLTVGCAQCHSHKYDPIAQREYYGLFAFFNSVSEVEVPAPRASDAQAYATAKAAFDTAHAPLVSALATYERDVLATRQAAWEKSLKIEPTDWAIVEPSELMATGKVTLKSAGKGIVIAGGPAADTSTYTVGSPPRLKTITAMRLEVFTHPSLPKMGPGRAGDGNFVLSDVRLALRTKPAGAAKATLQPLAIRHADADHSQQGFAIENAIDDKPTTGWGVAPHMGSDHVAVFELATTATVPEGAELIVTLDQQYKGKFTIGRFRVAVTGSAAPVQTNGLAASIAALVAKPAAERTAVERERLAAYHRHQDPEWQRLKAAVTAHQRRAPIDPGTTTKAQALAELSAPRETHILVRGDFLRPGAAVQPSTFEALPPLAARGARPDRLDLAAWLVSPANPLTPRVTVNRVWAHYFGRGLVATGDDFGTQGEKPSHAELLDALAREFVAPGWSLKSLHKLIVSSATYRQASRTRPELLDRDAYNVLLARQRRNRVEAEVIRDLALSASGLLDETIGGPSVRPRQPAGISELTYANAARWVESQGADRYRRGLYTWFQRTSPYPMLMTFDAPDSNVTCTRRERSNTPLQALTLLNDPVFFECAQALGRRVVREAPAVGNAAEVRDARMRYAFRLCLARAPSPAELAALRALYERESTLAQADTAAAGELVGPAPKPAGTTDAELAAWIVVGRTLMNLDEFIVRE